MSLNTGKTNSMQFLVFRRNRQWGFLAIQFGDHFRSWDDLRSGINFDAVQCVEDITRWQEDMNFMLEWQEQQRTSERSERVRFCSCYENIKFTSSS